MKRSYLGAVSGEDGVFDIIFLDFPGCTSVASSLDGVLVSGAEALTGHIEAMLDDGDAIPAPTHHDLRAVIDWLQEGEDDEGRSALEHGWLGLFPVNVEIDEQPGLVTLRMRAELIQRIADTAEAQAGLLNSRAFIERAIEHELEARKNAA